MDLSGTARVILGMLRIKPMSGYEIKQAVDQSTRFFWAASYGQIYPELRRLSREELIEGEQAARGARRRTVYTLTRKGEEALDAWLEEPPEPPELRFEGLLKLFFLRPEEREIAARHLQTMRHQNSATLRRLREIEPAARALPEGSPLLVLRSGITAFEAIEGWLEDAEHRLGGVAKASSKPRTQAKRRSTGTLARRRSGKAAKGSRKGEGG
jgi:PadR family transcriptional regulator AphA